MKFPSLETTFKAIAAIGVIITAVQGWRGKVQAEGDVNKLVEQQNKIIERYEKDIDRYQSIIIMLDSVSSK